MLQRDPFEKCLRYVNISSFVWLARYTTITVTQGVFVARRGREGSIVWCGSVAPVLFRGFPLACISLIAVVAEKSRKQSQTVYALESLIFRDRLDTKYRADVSLVFTRVLYVGAVFREEREATRSIRTRNCGWEGGKEKKDDEETKEEK